MSDLIVVKLGGTTLAEQRPVLGEVAALARRAPVAVVHGGGNRLTDWLARLGVPSRFEDGLRVTDEASVEVAVAVLGGLVNAELVAALRDLGADAVGLTGVDGDLLAGERVEGLGLVAHVVGIRSALLDAVLAAGFVPVVAPLARDESGLICNVNADDAAAGLAGGAGARELVLLTDVDGVRAADGHRFEALTVAEAEELVAAGVIRGGMVPKVRAGLAAVQAGTAEAVIAQGSVPGALGRALTDRTFGTRLRPVPQQVGAP
jgi:acetylglutamate kinase